MFTQQTGYATPKLGVRGAVCSAAIGFCSSARWLTSTAGRCREVGADVNESPADAVARESTRGGRLSGASLQARRMWDRARHPHGRRSHSTFGRLFFMCEITGGAPEIGPETSEVAFFGEYELPVAPSIRRVLLPPNPTHVPNTCANRTRQQSSTEHHLPALPGVRRLGQSQVQSYPRNAIGRSMLAISAGSISPCVEPPAHTVGRRRGWCDGIDPEFSAGAHSTAIDRVIAAMRPFQPSDRLAIGIVTPFIVDWRRHQASAFRKGLSERS